MLGCPYDWVWIYEGISTRIYPGYTSYLGNQHPRYNTSSLYLQVKLYTWVTMHLGYNTSSLYLLRIFVLTDRAKDFCLNPKQAGAFHTVHPPPSNFYALALSFLTLSPWNLLSFNENKFNGLFVIFFLFIA